MAINGGTSGSYLVQWHGPYRATTYKENLAVNIYCAPSNDTPRLYSEIYYNISRASERDGNITVHINGLLLRSTLDTAKFGYYVKLYFIVNGQEYLIANKPKSPSSWSYNIQETVNGYDIVVPWASNDRLPIGIRAEAGCHIAAENWCQSGNNSTTIINASVPKYVSRIDPTPQTDGAIYSTNNTGGVRRGTISDKPDLKVWWDWWGQTEGTVGFTQSNVDIATVNDSNQASSVTGITDKYVQNTKVNIWDIAKAKNAKIGDTLYCWVNTLTKEGVWMGKKYLGALKLRKDGKIQYKDGSGAVREITKVYYKDGSGSIKKGRYLKVKDGSGGVHIIDTYTTLYE